jgi:hypothetical protein
MGIHAASDETLTAAIKICGEKRREIRRSLIFEINILKSIFGNQNIAVIQRNEKECITVCEKFQRAK